MGMIRESLTRSLQRPEQYGEKLAMLVQANFEEKRQHQ